jgi:hypothetical protein
MQLIYAGVERIVRMRTGNSELIYYIKVIIMFIKWKKWRESVCVHTGLTSAYCAWQLAPVDIWWTGKWATFSFNEIKQCAVFICTTISYGNRAFIHACIHCTIVSVSFRHEVSFVLKSPSHWTHVTTWYHDLRSTLRDMTNCTWNIVLEQVAGK